MPADSITVPSNLLARFTDVGVDVTRLLAEARLPRARFEEPKAHLTTQEFFALWHAVGKVAGLAAVLRLGSCASPSQLNVSSIAALHSPTLRAALDKFARYKRVCCAEEVSITTRDAEASLQFHWVYAEGPLPLMLVDVTFASALALARNGSGQPVAPRRLELARRPAEEALLVRHFGCPVRFDAAEDRLVFDASALDLPFVTHNADLLATLVPGLEAALGATRTTLASEVKAALTRRMGGEKPSIDKVASDLHVSSRTLQRKLGDAGTSYQRVLDEVRRDAARRLLQHTDLDASEVAFMLGFEEVNSFTRAFHGWEGTTPKRWRRAGETAAFTG